MSTASTEAATKQLTIDRQHRGWRKGNDMAFEGKEIWFAVGSQDLYGEEALREVAQ